MTTEMIVTELAQLPGLSERILLSELNHRINNEFAAAINRVSIDAVRADHPVGDLVEADKPMRQCAELLNCKRFLRR